MQTPWLGLFGDLDKGIPVESVEELRTALGDAPVAGRHRPLPRRRSRVPLRRPRRATTPESAADAWQRALEWFDTHLG